MKQQECVMPEHCIGCGRVFDLWSYFLREDRTSRRSIDQYRIHEFLCNECQASVTLENDVLTFSDEEDYGVVDEFVGGDDATLSSR